MTLPITSPNATSPDAPRRPRRSWTPAEQAAHLADFAASRTGGFAAVTVAPDTAPAAVPVAALAPSLTLVLRAPSGVAADVAGLDLAAAAALLRAVLMPATAGAA